MVCNVRGLHRHWMCHSIWTYKYQNRWEGGPSLIWICDCLQREKQSPEDTITSQSTYKGTSVQLNLLSLLYSTSHQLTSDKRNRDNGKKQKEERTQETILLCYEQKLTTYFQKKKSTKFEHYLTKIYLPQNYGNS